jgi:hypothetical protein
MVKLIAQKGKKKIGIKIKIRTHNNITNKQKTPHE